MVELRVEFKSNEFTVTESSGFVEVAVTISGGSSTTPINVMVTTSEQSATGKELYCSLWKIHCWIFSCEKFVVKCFRLLG